MKRVIFSSDELPATLDDSARFRLWRDLYVAHHGEVDMTPQTNQPFTAKAEFVGIGAIMLMRFDAAIRGTARTLRQVAADGRDHFLIRFNRGGALSYAQHGREVVDNGGGGVSCTAAPSRGKAVPGAASRSSDFRCHARACSISSPVPKTWWALHLI